METMDEIIAHLGAALAQVIKSDDEIIVSHIRSAYAIAKDLVVESCEPDARKYPKIHEALRELVTRCDGEEGMRADGSNINTCAAHAALGDFLPPFDCPSCGQHITDDMTCGCNGAPRVRRTV